MKFFITLIIILIMRIDCNQDLEKQFVSMKRYFGANKLDEALRLTTFLLQKNRKDVKVLIYRAKVFYGMGDIESSLIWVKNALKYDPELKEGKIIFKFLKKFQKSKKKFENFYNEKKYINSLYELNLIEENFIKKSYNIFGIDYSRQNFLDMKIKECDMNFSSNLEYFDSCNEIFKGKLIKRFWDFKKKKKKKKNFMILKSQFFLYLYLKLKLKVY